MYSYKFHVLSACEVVQSSLLTSLGERGESMEIDLKMVTLPNTKWDHKPTQKVTKRYLGFQQPFNLLKQNSLRISRGC